MKTKVALWDQHSVTEGLRPRVGECVRQAGGDVRVIQRAVVRGMSSDRCSAQWQLNDSRSVDSVSVNQTTPSNVPLFFNAISSSALFSPPLSQPQSREKHFVPTLYTQQFSFRPSSRHPWRTERMRPLSITLHQVRWRKSQRGFRRSSLRRWPMSMKEQAW